MKTSIISKLVPIIPKDLLKVFTFNLNQDACPSGLHTEEEAHNFATHVLASSLLMVHDAIGSGPKVTSMLSC